MTILTTLDSGQYSPTLCIRAGVNACTEYLYPSDDTNFGVVPIPVDKYYNQYTNRRFNSRIQGSYDLNKFNGGYFNFETWAGKDLYSTNGLKSGTQIHTNGEATANIYDYWEINGTATANGVVGTTQYKNICRALVVKGSSVFPYDDNPNTQLYTPYGMDTTVSGCTIYGRFKLGGTESPVSYPIGQILRIGDDDNHIQLKAEINPIWETKFGGVSGPSVTSNATLLDEQTNSALSHGEFYNFWTTYDATTGYAVFSEWFDGSTNGTIFDNNGRPTTFAVANLGTGFANIFGSYSSNLYDRFYYVGESDHVIWTDYGIANNATIDLYGFYNHRNRPQYSIFENIISEAPAPSGSDTTYLNFHYPVRSSGFQSVCNQGSSGLLQFYVPLSSGEFSTQFYEFDRSQFNPTALALDLWVENSGTHPSGYLGAMIDFNTTTNVFGLTVPVLQHYWSGLPISINNNAGPQLVRMSGNFYNSSHGPSDLTEVTLEETFNAALKLGSWCPSLGGTSYNTDIRIYSARVKLDSWCTPLSTGNAITLYTSGQIKEMESLDLYLQQSTEYNNLDLYIKGGDSTSSGIPLFIAGDFSFGNIPLYIGGHDSTNSGIPLVITGGYETANMPLYISGPIPGTLNSGLPLFMWATTNSGQSSNMTLFVGENAPSGVQSAGMNLFVQGPHSARVTASMNLFIKKDIDTEHGSVTLYCQNSNVLNSGSLTLFLQTKSGTLGAVPVSGAMNLFIARDSEAIAHNTTLYVSGPNSGSEAISMYINGGTPYFSSIPLYINAKGVEQSDPLKLYTHGF
jgi:hypothetical protein